MKTYFKNYIRNLDYIMLFCYLFLCLFGLVMIYSSSQMVAIRLEQQDPDFFYNKQLFFLKIAWPLFFLMAIIPYKRWNNVKILGAMTIALIIIMLWVAFFGIEANGSQSWINVFGITTFQPSEYAKFFIIIYFAGAFYNKSIKKQYGSIQELTLNDLLKPIALWLMILLFVSIETDLGAVMILFVIAVSIIFASGLKGRILKKFMLAITFFGTIVVIGGVLFKWDSIMNSSRGGRFTSYLNPFEYADSLGFQVVNGYYAIGSGGLSGLGLGQSVQKLGYLPEPHTDFIMAIISEELGILGVGAVLLCIGYIVLRGFWIAMNTKQVMPRIIAAGVATWIAFQTFINVGGLSGLIPLTGVTLPFISSGGSSILMLSLAVGILLNVSTLYKIENRKS